MNWQDRIAINLEILAGKPVIRGTRLAVEFIVELRSEGWTDEEIMENYPGICVDDIQACLAYDAHSCQPT
jgi:uncharacterized protein (DUF433 family)